MIFSEWEKKLSEFCINKCPSVCCENFEKIIMTQEQHRKISKYSKVSYTKMGSLFKVDAQPKCPAYINRKCAIHKDKPEGCTRFPLIKGEKTIKLDNRCSMSIELKEELKNICEDNGYLFLE